MNKGTGTLSKKNKIVYSLKKKWLQLAGLFVIHCPICGGDIHSIDTHNGMNVYQCKQCGKKYI